MIKIENNTVKHIDNFWNSCIFHPTDAVEDPWGRRILDRIAKDRSIHTVRIYAMFEDIAYLDENGNVAYDFRLSDLRLDYLVEKGFNILIAYGMMPELFSSDKNELSSVSKNKTRYKGKMLYTAKPKDYKLWEELCYEYTKHIVERYGEETVSKWYLHCYNEPDIGTFFMKNVKADCYEERVKEYFKLYEGFVSGILRVTDKLFIGGPALAHNLNFLDSFLKKVKENDLRLDYISVHNYAGSGPHNLKEKGFCTDYWIAKHNEYMSVLRSNGMENIPLVYDEWGMASHGFYNIEECPSFIARETEVFSSYYVKLIYELIKENAPVSLLMLCLSGQHEMVTDFSGFRNFFTLNFFAKPIYNAFVLASKLKNELLNAEYQNNNLFVIPTKNDDGEYSVLLTYSSSRFEENLPQISEELAIDNLPENQTVTVYCIDKTHANPYRLYEKNGFTHDLTDEQIKMLRDEGNIKPVASFSSNEKIKLDLTANSVYLVTTERKK